MALFRMNKIQLILQIININKNLLTKTIEVKKSINNKIILFITIHKFKSSLMTHKNTKLRKWL